MYQVLLKGQLPKALLIVLLFMCILFMSTKAEESSLLWGLTDSQTKYINEHYDGDRNKFFDTFNADYDAADERVKAIENFTMYDGERPDEVLNPVIQAAGGGGALNVEMIKWRRDMLAMPGVFSETVSGDQGLFMGLERRLNAQEKFDINLLSNQEIMRRSIKRGQNEASIYHEKVPMYETALAQYDKVDPDFDVIDTYYVDRTLDYADNDYYIIILVALCVFSVFSGCAQSKVSNQILVSPGGIRLFTLKQIGATLTVVMICLIAYFAGSFFILTAGNQFSAAWGLPIQAIVGYENIPLAVSAGTFLVIHHGMKALFCIMIAAFILLASMLSQNNIISAMLSVGICGALMLLYNSDIGAVRTNELFGVQNKIAPLFIGGSKLLFEDLPYLLIGDTTVHYALVVGITMIVMTLVLLSLTLLVSKPAMKWRAAR